jgi:alpha-L-fucosidase
MLSTDVVLTSKHHEGWCNFRGSYHWNWNSVDAGPKMDLVGNLTASVRAAGLHMGLYHSLREWYNPLYLEDNANNCSDPKFPDEVLLPTLKEIVNQYKVQYSI